MTNNFMGRDGFIWFFGKVVDRHDPLALGRIKVRIYGVHPEDENLVPNDHLPWAMPIQPITSAAFAGIGTSPTGVIEGSTVFGFFADGSDSQLPFILGTVATGIGHFVLDVITTVKDGIETVKEVVAPVKTVSEISGSYAVKAGPYGSKMIQDLSLTDYQVAGILGNLAHESSGLIPDIMYGGKRGPSLPNTTYGWAQWRGTRRKSFIQFVKDNFDGYDIEKNSARDDHNYAFVLHELNTSEKAALNALRNTKSLEEATAVFLRKFERAGAEGESSLAQRTAKAKQALNSIKGVSVPVRSTAKNQVNG